jgi:predicted dienelactone hydrolase
MRLSMPNWIPGIALATCLLLPQPSAADKTAVNTAANAGEWGNFEVGSAIVHLDLQVCVQADGGRRLCPTGITGEGRPMDVLLWYPADKQAYRTASPTVYSSRMNGMIIDRDHPDRWDPMSWTVTAERARDGVAVDHSGPSFPLIIHSHPGPGEPYDRAPTLERLASHGFIVIAPWHNRDTRDDERFDIINQRAKKIILPRCLDGGSIPCLDGARKAVQNRALDVAAILNNFEQPHGVLRSFFADRVDTSHVGLLGQSRGSVTALALAGGSKLWNIQAEPRIGAIMLLAIGMPNVTFAQDVAKITVPSLLVAGKIDRNTLMHISVDAFNMIPSRPSQQKALVILERAEHGVYSSQRCAQMQAVGAIFQDNPRAIGEQLTLESIMLSPTSGTPIDFCLFDSFVKPVDIRPVIEARTGFQVTPSDVRLENPCQIEPEFPIQIQVPRQLDTDTAMRLVLELANTFFDAVLVKNARPGVHFKQYLSPKFLLLKEGEPVSYAKSESFQGRAVECDDLELASLDPECGE